MGEYIFFDSHGDAWVTCDPSDPEAHAFGPRGAAKRGDWANPNHPGYKGAGQTAYAAACELDAVNHGDEWDWAVLKEGWYSTGDGRWLFDGGETCVIAKAR